MDMELIISLHEWDLSQKQEEAKMQITRLEKDARQDEANLLKARRNVFSHFQTALKVYSGLGEGALEKYRELMQKMYDVWSDARNKAELHNDIQKLAVEETKLKAWQEAMSLLEGRIGEGKS